MKMPAFSKLNKKESSYGRDRKLVAWKEIVLTHMAEMF